MKGVKIRMSKIAALVPMRHHSQRVPGKNYRLLAGKPLFHHIIEALLACQLVDEVIVDTDSQPVMESLRGFFSKLEFWNALSIYGLMIFL